MLRLSLHILQKFSLCDIGQEPALRLNYEEDDLDVSVNIHFDLARVPLEEAVRDIFLKILESLPVTLNYIAELIEQVINVESLADLTVERVRLETVLDPLK